MRIDDRNAASGGVASRSADVESSQGVAGGKGSASYLSRLGTDSVELSGSSRVVRNFETARSARIEHLAKSVQSGSYSVSPALISRALLNETLAAAQPE